MNSERPVIALTAGDCTGIGPEQTARILHDQRMADVARIVVVGDARTLDLGKRQAGVSFAYRSYQSPASVDWSDSAVPLIDLGNTDPSLYEPGVASAESGRLTGDTLARAIDFAVAGEVDAVTFAPLNKRAMYDGGWKFPDEHKMFAHLLGHHSYFSEMNVLDGQWMSRVTSHVSLRQAVDQITRPAIEEAIVLATTMMRKAGIAKPRLAVAALNPHAGENGLFGTDEIEIIRPAVEAMAAKGIDCKGPFPSDTVYLKAFAGEFDGVLAMYHDQGQIATKMRGFNRGVTVTAGLDTVFTTPAHGTAFDIVGKGIADTGAFENAIKLASQLARFKQLDS
ncbi:4-hydroxythreonine-4-phosphate dehydrogenase PdxA [Phyllobacterium sp. BT25]|uniref:4-hydroxythreonine-4-phosphate dehydrogenase PdxA n=1 Tax=Phyllobacterium pellucidum TaxID=2740464 RepID=A0A849VZL4_9HYPH|nr:4-hydroxythreonine-4-phosphate dehydrogenase PdxA [Phyllobacterium pellucidum]NTS33310.1 4-hydroxythreonine-4-phosphate dehydrogenase PdxA [Phyllobacterium pellucidum]